jgi:tetratricopeptide (TPR) repeat protein
MAQMAESQGQKEKALEQYRIVAAMRPTLPGLHFSMGHLLWQDERLEEAVAELQKELRLNPNYAEANAEVGTIYVSQHEPEKGIPYLERAVGLKPGLLEARRQLGKGYSQLGRFKDAEVQLKLALPGDRNGGVYYTLGVVYRELGRAEESTKAFETSRRIKAERLAEAMITPKEAAEQ